VFPLRRCETVFCVFHPGTTLDHPAWPSLPPGSPALALLPGLALIGGWRGGCPGTAETRTRVSASKVRTVFCVFHPGTTSTSCLTSPASWVPSPGSPTWSLVWVGGLAVWLPGTSKPRTRVSAPAVRNRVLRVSPWSHPRPPSWPALPSGSPSWALLPDPGSRWCLVAG